MANSVLYSRPAHPILKWIRGVVSGPSAPSQIHGLIQRLSIGPGAIDRRAVAFIAARRREGASTIARDYAHGYALETGKKVLLIDAGPYSPKQYRSFGLDGSLGLVDAMLAGESPEAAVKSLGGGSVHAARWLAQEKNLNAASQLIHNQKFWAMLRDEFDMIVIDAPPLQIAFDGVMLATRADAVVMVVEAEKTPEPVVRHLRDTLEGSGAKIAGIVMNKRRFYIPNRVYRRL